MHIQKGQLFSTKCADGFEIIQIYCSAIDSARLCFTQTTGYFDMVAYEKFNNGEMSDYIPTDEDLEAGFRGIPQFPGNE